MTLLVSFNPVEYLSYYSTFKPKYFFVLVSLFLNFVLFIQIWCSMFINYFKRINSPFISQHISVWNALLQVIKTTLKFHPQSKETQNDSVWYSHGPDSGIFERAIQSSLKRMDSAIVAEEEIIKKRDGSRWDASSGEEGIF